MYSQFRTISIVVSGLLAGSLFLTGCGGGGGDTATTTTTSSVTLSGTAVDELILNGVVEVRANSAAGTVIGSGRTSATDGTYTLNLAGFDGVAVVSVTCDANSRLLVNGVEETCPTTTRLYSAAPVDGTGAVTVNIAPATDIMFAMATAGNPDATLSKTQVEEARAATAQIFGTDPVASDPTEGTYAAVIEAFHAAAEEANLSIQEFVDQLAEDAADGTVGDDSPTLTTLLASSMLDTNVTTPFVVAVEETGTFDPQEVAPTDDITAAKDFFDNLRTQGYSLADNGGFFDQEARGIESAVESVTLNADLASSVLGNTISTILTVLDAGETSGETVLVTLGDIERKVVVTQDSTDTTLWDYTIDDINTVDGSTVNRGKGTVVMPDVDLSNDTFLASDFNLSATFDGTIPATKLYETTQRTQTFKAGMTLTKSTDGADFTVSNVELSTADGTKLGISAFSGNVGYDYDTDTNETTLNYVKLNTLTLNGALDTSYTAAGTLKVDYTQNTALQATGGFSEYYTTEIDGHAGCYDSDGNPTDPYSGAINVTIEGTTYSVTADSDGHFHGTISGAEYTYDQVSAATVDFQESCPASSDTPTIDNLYVETWADDVIGNNGWIPSAITFDGDIKNIATNSELIGKAGVELLNAATLELVNLADIDSDVTGDPEVKVILSGTLKREGLDDTVLNLTYQNQVSTETKKTVANTLTVGYVYGTTVANIASDFDANIENGTIDLSSGNGLAMTLKIKEGDIDYENTTALTKDGKTVGYLDDETGIPRIKYVDGSFESLP